MNWMQPPTVDNCVLCGEPLQGRPYVMVDYPKAAHTSCVGSMDIREVAESELPWLRRLYADLEQLQREVKALGKWLVAQSRTGGNPEARTVYEYSRRKRELARRLSEFSPEPPASRAS